MRTKECARYEAKIKALGGVDLQLLGIGHNGHIGFNEPNGQFDRTTHCVNLTQSTIEANKRFLHRRRTCRGRRTRWESRRSCRRIRF